VKEYVSKMVLSKEKCETEKESGILLQLFVLLVLASPFIYIVYWLVGFGCGGRHNDVKFEEK
jgi:hypothetical protein